jgi:hypothetical protein
MPRSAVGAASAVDIAAPGHRDCRESMKGGSVMATCEVCGNDYDKSFEVTAAGNTHVFDSFECAIHRLAPICEHCDCRVIGHGVEVDGHFYCCANCARMADASSKVADRG